MKRKKRLSMLELLRNLCPDKNSSITSITISVGCGDDAKGSITLTQETREKINKLLEKGE